MSSHYLGDGASTRHDRSRLFELARVLVRLDDVASFIINVNHCVVRTAQKLGVVDCTADCVWLAVPQPTEWQHVGNEIKAAMIWKIVATLHNCEFAPPHESEPSPDSEQKTG